MNTEIVMMKWQERWAVRAGVVVCLVLLCGACERMRDKRDVKTVTPRSEERAVTCAAARTAVGAETRQAQKNARMPAELTMYEQALSGAAGSATNVLAAQLRSSRTFEDKRRATAAAINSRSGRDECVACALLLLQQASNYRERALANRDLGYVFLRFNEYDASTGAFTRMLTEMRGDEDDAPELRYRAHVGLASAHAVAGKYEAQLSHARQALEEARKTENSRFVAAAKDEMAMALINNRKLDEALEFINERLRDQPDNEFVKMLKEDAEKGRSPFIMRF
ncbi:MAG: hypothetical protein N2595_07810 [bacterium]|nr:hypothetical protein [bacterium]